MWIEDDYVGEVREKSGAATIDIEKDSKTYNFDLPQEDSASNDTSNLDSAQNESTKHAIWTFAYYQQFFDVDTNTVIQNIKDSLNPVAHVNRNKKYFGGKSDLYGPVWICATLVVVISVFGNLNYVFNRWTDHKDYKYTPQFEKVSLAGIVVYSYSFLIPSLIYGFVRWRSGPFDFYMSDFISTYGYSLLTFVPMSMLLLVRNDTFNWLLVVLTLAVSGTVLAAKVWGATRHLDKKSILILVLVVLTLHTSLVLFIKLYFFSHIKVEDVVQATTTSAGVNITQTGGS